MARLAGVCTGHKWPEWTRNGKQASACWAVYHVNLLTFGPSMARLLNAARAILARLVFSNEKACPFLESLKFGHTTFVLYTVGPCQNIFREHKSCIQSHVPFSDKLTPSLQICSILLHTRVL